MFTLEDATEYVETTYNYGISVYDYGDHIRVTNGSAGMYGDIEVRNDELLIEGERYGDRIQASFSRDLDGLQAALSELGL